MEVPGQQDVINDVNTLGRDGVLEEHNQGRSMWCFQWHEITSIGEARAATGSNTFVNSWSNAVRHDTRLMT